ncbi:MAG: shikimate dehydrogenase [Thermodesulfobacteriota bacterium]
MAKVSGTTRITGIFGDPVGHTLSPAVQNAAFEELELDMVYLPFHVREEALAGAVGAIRALNMAGVNVTIPHKESVTALLDEVDEDARNTGAVNTVVNTDGRLVGYNTDGKGFLASLAEETNFNPGGKVVMLLGAGGAARGILAALLKERPKKVIIANRTSSRAEALAEEFAGKFPDVEVEAAGLNHGPALEETELLVNSTSAGMEGKDVLDIPLEKLRPDAIVSDIVYSPLETALLKGAEKRGLRTHGGLGMLVHQGALGFELWTGKKAPIDIMRAAALAALEAK